LDGSGRTDAGTDPEPATAERARHKFGLRIRNVIRLGITQDTLAQWRRHAVSAADAARMPRDDAHAIYQDRYVVWPGFDRIGWSPLCAQVMDHGVLSGPGRATRHVQAEAGVTVGGVFGHLTEAAINARPCQIHAGLIVRRLRYLADIVRNDLDQVSFIEGWVARAGSFAADLI